MSTWITVDEGVAVYARMQECGDPRCHVCGTFLPAGSRAALRVACELTLDDRTVRVQMLVCRSCEEDGVTLPPEEGEKALAVAQAMLDAGAGLRGDALFGATGRAMREALIWIGAALLAAGLLALHGFAIARLWEWFVVPATGWPAVSLTTATGLCLLALATRLSMPDGTVEPEDRGRDLRQCATLVLRPVVALFAGWIVHLIGG